jgi:cyclophilin family peptidyl-prolyl cis-trans isomerase
MRLSLLPLLAVVAIATACDSTATANDQPEASSADAALLTPDPAALTATAPDSFTVTFVTSAGVVDVRVHRRWSPLGADRLHYLATSGFFDGARFFRVVPGFAVQFGLSGRPEVDEVFKKLEFDDEPVKVSNRRGTLVFATSGPNTRSTQLFFNLVDNTYLDDQRFTPVGEVVQGMDVVDRINPEYLEESNVQRRILREGNAFFRTRFPALDSIVSVSAKP